MLQPVIRKTLSDSAKEKLRQDIMSRDLGSSGKLPPEEQMAKNLNVSRVTIRSALKDLEQEGLVFRIHGKGTFMNPEARRIRANLGELSEFSSVIQKNGYAPRMRLLRVCTEPAAEITAKWLHLAPGAELIRVEKLYYADEAPAILSVAWLPRQIFQEAPTERDWAARNNFGLLYQQAGKIVTHDIVELSSASLQEMEAELSQSSGMTCQSVLCLTACAFDQENEPAIFGKAFYDTNRIRFQLFRSQEGNGA